MLDTVPVVPIPGTTSVSHIRSNVAAVRTHTEILPALASAAEDLRCLGDLGYQGESDTITVAFKKPKGGALTNLQQRLNKVHNGLRAIGERGNSLLKTTFKTLRNVSMDPRRIGTIVAAALVLLHFDHARTTWPQAVIRTLRGKAHCDQSC